jgi:uncharacterized membrane protein YagU involved in acid resistance
MTASNQGLAVVAGGLTAGLLDIAYALSFAVFVRGGTVQGLLQSVSSGLLGQAAFEGGSATAALGLALHFAIALGWALVFALASERFALLRHHPNRVGPVYGLFIFLMMNFVVLPLSALPMPVRWSWLGSGTNLLSHLFFVGLPIAWAVHLASRRSSSFGVLSGRTETKGP